MGQVPTERVTPDLVFDRVGVDYAGPLQLKLGSTRKPVIVKSYVCAFVSLFEQCIWNLYLIGARTHLSHACDDSFPGEESLPLFGAIMAQTLLVLLVRSRNW